MEEATVTLTRKEYKEKSQKVFNKFMNTLLAKDTNPVKVLMDTLVASIIIDEIENSLFGEEKENN